VQSVLSQGESRNRRGTRKSKASRQGSDKEAEGCRERKTAGRIQSMEIKTVLQEHVIQRLEGKEDRRWDVETMTYGFKITSWEGHSAIQVKTIGGSLYLDGEDVQALREHLMAPVIAELERRAIKCGLHESFDKCDAYNKAIALIKNGVEK